MMSCRVPAAFLAVLSAALLGIPSCGAVKEEKKPTYYTFCFWDRFSQWRQAPYNFNVNSIPAELCNAVIYSHVTIDDKTGRLKLTSQELKLDPDARNKASSFIYSWIWLLPPHRIFAQMKELKGRNPKLKILLAVGGPQDPVEKYWKYLLEMHLWRDTAASLAQWLRTYDFDGVVFDFFSGSTTFNDSPRTWDQAKLIHPFIREVHTNFLDYPQKWRIALTIPAFDSRTHHLFDIKRLNNVVNFFILKTSDCMEFPRGAGLDVTRTMDMTDVDRAEFLVQKGALRQRIVLDIPFSGRTYTATGSASQTVFTGHSGPYTKQRGSLAFFELCDHIKTGWKRERFGEETCSFLNLGNEYVAYEDQESIQRKARMVMGRQYRGAAVHTVDLDDITGSCTRKFYLLKALREQLDEKSYYVNFYYQPPNTKWWNETDQSDWGGPKRPFTQPAAAKTASTATFTNDTATPVPPTRPVPKGPGVPTGPHWFPPGFYAEISSSLGVPSSTVSKAITTTKLLVPQTTPAMDSTKEEAAPTTSSPESKGEHFGAPVYFVPSGQPEAESSTAVLNASSTNATTMKGKLLTTQTTVPTTQQEMTLPVKENTFPADTALSDAKEVESSPFTVHTTALATAYMTTSPTTNPFTNQITTIVSSSQVRETSLTPNTPQAKTTIMPEETLTSTIENDLVDSTVTELSSSSVTATTDYEAVTSEIVNNICKSEDIHKLLPHETDCDKYYQCVHFTPHLRSCPANTVFDIARQVCNWPKIAKRPECIL